MNLGIDHARQHVQPAAVDGLAGGRLRQIADRRDPAGRYRQVARDLAVMIDDDTAAKDQIEGLRHSNLPLL